MAVEKMHFINIVGPINSLDEFVSQRLIHYDIELVNTMSILDDVKGITPYIVENPYTHLLKSAKEALGKLGIEVNEDDLQRYNKNCITDLETTEDYMDEVNKKLVEWEENKNRIEDQIKFKQKLKKQLTLLQDLDVDVDKFFHFKFIKFRFGSLPVANFEKLDHYTENVDVIPIEVFREEDLVYIMYFCPEEVHEKIDSLFSSLYFHRIFISGEVEGHPKEALEKVKEDIRALEKKLHEQLKLIRDYGKDHIEQLKQIYYSANKYYQVFHVRRFAAHSKEIFCIHGWISNSELKDFKVEMNQDSNISYVVEEPEDVPTIQPPTKLKNNPLFRPFQVLVDMYGTPSYDEIDPTPFVALTYMLFFGMMFGDIGQGLVLALCGYFFYKKKGILLGKVITMTGLSSMFFGVIYGSVFGNEEFLEELVHGIPVVSSIVAAIKPMEDQYLILGIGIGIGVCLILIAMIINIINALRKRDFGKALFDKNGVVGLVFYIALLGIAAGMFFKMDYYSHPVYVILLIIVPLFIFFFSHPLIKLINRAKNVIPKEKGSFFVESFFEVVEILLSIFSNTLSFMRIGAFALNHVGLFMAVKILADMTGSVASIFIFILGNVIIIGLEGLIVFIQGLRLEYYEMFSRFYQGDGRQLKPFKIKYESEV